jgi:hypothetical protein
MYLMVKAEIWACTMCGGLRNEAFFDTLEIDMVECPRSGREASRTHRFLVINILSSIFATT